MCFPNAFSAKMPNQKGADTMKTRMTKLISAKSMSPLGLVLLTGVTLITGIVWAKATEYPVDCEFTYAPTQWPPPRLWTDEEGVTHMRDIPYTLNSKPDTGNMAVAMTGTCNHNRDMATGDGDFWGDDHAVEVTWGELSGTFRGHYGGITISHEGFSNHAYQGISGDFVGWKLKLNGTWDFTNKKGVLEGTLQNPHGD
jgi:hypothetical protein